MRRTCFTVLCCLFLFLPTALGFADSTLFGRVSFVYDGDTIEVDRVGRVRLLGIDAPESEASERDVYYQRRFRVQPPRLRATARQARALVTRYAHNQLVRLEFDREKKDRYGRSLAYVYLPDGRLLNLVLLEEGLATVFRRADFRLKKQFFATERQARRQQRGLWRGQGR